MWSWHPLSQPSPSLGPLPRTEASHPSWCRWRQSTWTTSPTCSHPAPPPLAHLSCPSSSSSSSPSLHQPAGLARSRVLHMSLHPGHPRALDNTGSPIHSDHLLPGSPGFQGLCGSHQYERGRTLFCGSGCHGPESVMTHQQAWQRWDWCSGACSPSSSSPCLLGGVTLAGHQELWGGLVPDAALA